MFDMRNTIFLEGDMILASPIRGGTALAGEGAGWKSSENVPESVLGNSTPTPPSLRDTSPKKGG